MTLDTLCGAFDAKVAVFVGGCVFGIATENALMLKVATDILDTNVTKPTLFGVCRLSCIHRTIFDRMDRTKSHAHKSHRWRPR